MRKWGIEINSYYKTAYYWLEEAPWWVFVIEDAMDFICGYLVPPISLPNWKFKLKPEDANFGDEQGYTTLREWYGDLDDVFCMHVHNPVLNWCWSKKKELDIASTWEWMEEHHPEEMKRGTKLDEDS
jgi:hypothetical protein